MQIIISLEVNTLKPLWGGLFRTPYLAKVVETSQSNFLKIYMTSHKSQNLMLIAFEDIDENGKKINLLCHTKSGESELNIDFSLK